MSVTRYPIRIGRRSRVVLLAFGVTTSRAWIDIGDGRVSARFGWFRMQVPLENVTRWRIEGPWRWITAIGVRRSVRGGDLSFAGSPRGGVRIDFREPVRSSGFRVSAFYLGVDDREGFAGALAAAGIPGEDARRA